MTDVCGNYLASWQRANAVVQADGDGREVKLTTPPWEFLNLQRKVGTLRKKRECFSR
jgi:hypothetical protein